MSWITRIRRSDGRHVLELLDASLSELVGKTAGIKGLTVSFAAPDGEFSASAPAVSFFLYEIRENVELRGQPWRTDPPPTGGGAAQTTTARRAPARMECAYLVTAWPGKVDDPVHEEHRVLGAVLRTLLRHRTLPERYLARGFPTQDVPMPITVLSGGRLPSAGEFWQAMGRRPKAALHCTVTVGVDLADPVEIGSYVVTEPHVTVADGLDRVRT